MCSLIISSKCDQKFDQKFWKFACLKHSGVYININTMPRISKDLDKQLLPSIWDVFYIHFQRRSFGQMWSGDVWL